MHATTTCQDMSILRVGLSRTGSPTTTRHHTSIGTVQCQQTHRSLSLSILHRSGMAASHIRSHLDHNCRHPSQCTHLRTRRCMRNHTHHFQTHVGTHMCSYPRQPRWITILYTRHRSDKAATCIHRHPRHSCHLQAKLRPTTHRSNRKPHMRLPLASIRSFRLCNRPRTCSDSHQLECCCSLCYLYTPHHFDTGRRHTRPHRCHSCRSECCLPCCPLLCMPLYIAV